MTDVRFKFVRLCYHISEKVLLNYGFSWSSQPIIRESSKSPA